MSITDLRYSVHPIDIAEVKVKARSIQDGADLVSFARNLISSTALANEHRKFRWPTESALVPGLLRTLVSNAAEFTETTQILAERLHQKEINAQKEVAHLNVEVQKGSLLQMVFKQEGTPHVLLVKAQLESFLNSTEYKRTEGYPIEDAVLKMCLVEFDAQHRPITVSVSDSNSRLSTFWWKDFLELTEVSTDESNTTTALHAMNALLVRKLKKDYKSDYYQLNNNLIGYFRTRKDYNHAKMLDYVFGDYNPIDKQLSLQELWDTAKALPSKKGFDQRFKIDADSVDKRRRTVVPLTDQINLEIKDAIENLPETIRSGLLEDGTKGVFVRSDSGFEHFRTQGNPARVEHAN